MSSYGFSVVGNECIGATRGAGVEQLAVFGGVPDQWVLLSQRQGESRRAVQKPKGLLAQALDDCAHLPAPVDVVMQRVVASPFDERRGIVLRRCDDAPHAAVADATFSIEQLLTQIAGR